MMRQSDKQLFEGTHYLLHLEPGSVLSHTRENVTCAVRCTVYTSLAWGSLFPASEFFLKKKRLKSALNSRRMPLLSPLEMTTITWKMTIKKGKIATTCCSLNCDQQETQQVSPCLMCTDLLYLL